MSLRPQKNCAKRHGRCDVVRRIDRFQLYGVLRQRLKIRTNITHIPQDKFTVAQVNLGAHTSMTAVVVWVIAGMGEPNNKREVLPQSEDAPID